MPSGDPGSFAMKSAGPVTATGVGGGRLPHAPESEPESEPEAEPESESEPEPESEPESESESESEPASASESAAGAVTVPQPSQGATRASEVSEENETSASARISRR